MRNLKKNQKKLWYALYQGMVPVLDENGDEDGSPVEKYSEPIEFEASLSAGASQAQQEIFGVNVDFTRSLSTTDLELPITETSLIWHETEPIKLDDGSVDASTADYTVSAKPIKSLNQLMIALKARKKNG